MKVSYHRELYRSRMRCELAEDESDYGYPLQMCLRNTISGLLPCNIELMDGRTYICWDITSRNSLKDFCDGNRFTLELLERVLQAVYAIMRELDNYLISNGYLVLAPEHIYLDASRRKVEFVCDFEEDESFQNGMQKLAEDILAKIDHKDQEQMRLGYGLYRLAVQENFLRDEFQFLLFKKETKKEPWTSSEFFDTKKCLSEVERGLVSDQKIDDYSSNLSKDTIAAKEERKKILDSFFMEEEEEKQGSRGYLLLYVLLVGAAVCGLEVLFYFRNGRHIHLGWLVVGALVIVACMGISVIGQYTKSSGEKQHTKEENKVKKSSQESYEPVKVKSNDIRSPKDTFSYEGVGETMVLQNSTLDESECFSGILEPVKEGDKVLKIPTKGAVLGKLSETADIILPSPAISRIHARIIREEEEYFIQDLNSRNGTWINGISLVSQQMIQLKSGDEVRFADLTYRFYREREDVSREINH